MGLLNIIRKLRLRLGLEIRVMSRRTGLSRNTVKKKLKDGTIEPEFATPDRSCKGDRFAEACSLAEDRDGEVAQAANTPHRGQLRLGGPILLKIETVC